MRFTLTKKEALCLTKDELNELKGYDAIKNDTWIKQCVHYISAVAKKEAQKKYYKWRLQSIKDLE